MSRLKLAQTFLGTIGDDKELPEDGYKVVSPPSTDVSCSDILVLKNENKSQISTQVYP